MNNLIELYRVDMENQNALQDLLRNREICERFVNAVIDTLETPHFLTYTKRQETIQQLRGMIHSRDYDFTWTIAMYIQHIYFLSNSAITSLIGRDKSIP